MDDLESRLTNWGLCQRLYWHPNHCGSAEWKYIRKRLTAGEEESRRSTKMVLDHRDAEIVEKAWRNMKTRRLQQVLKLSYVNNCAPKFICRHLGIPVTRDERHWLHELFKAYNEIERELKKKSVDKQSTQYLVSAQKTNPAYSVET